MKRTDAIELNYLAGGMLEDLHKWVHNRYGLDRKVYPVEVLFMLQSIEAKREEIAEKLLLLTKFN